MAIIYHENFEGADYFPSANGAINQIHETGWENCNHEFDSGGSVANSDNAAYNYGWTLTRVTSPVYAGSKSVKFEVRDCGDPPDTNLLVGSAQRVRSEVTIIKPQEDSWWPASGTAKEMWYSFAIRFPTSGSENDPSSHESIFQMYEDGGEDCLAKTINGRLYFACIQPASLTEKLYDMFGAPGAATTTSQSTAGTTFTPIPRDEWHVFVFHMIHSQGTDGLFEIWRDGTLLHSVSGRTMHSSILPKFKLGIYKSDYTAHPGRSIRPTRIIYFDDIRIGDADSVYADMVNEDAEPPSNIPPVANAGSNQTITLPTSTATLNGSGSSDSDGTISTYAWVKLSGPAGGSITSPGSASTGVAALQAGTYVYELTVTDNDGATDTDTVSILVNPIGYPLADAGPNQIITLPTNTATLDGTDSTDPDGTVDGYAWIKLSGPASGSITSPSSAVTGLTGLVEGVYVFQLTVTDNDSNTDTDTVQITVNAAANIAPVANAGSDQVIQLPTNSVTLNGSASSDEDGTIDGYEWTRISGPSSPTISTPHSVSTNITGLIAGVYVFRLTVTDNDDATDTDNVTVTVNAADPEPEPEPPVYVPSNWHQSIINRVNCC